MSGGGVNARCHVPPAFSAINKVWPEHFSIKTPSSPPSEKSEFLTKTNEQQEGRERTVSHPSNLVDPSPPPKLGER